MNKKQLRENVTIALVVIYLIGFVVANNYVADSCTHGNCKHGWNSKYNKKEKRIASLWIIGYPVLTYFLVTKLIPDPPKKPRNITRATQIFRKEDEGHIDSNVSPPVCPKCNSAMKLRIARKGSYTGKEFWGCSNFPRCKGIVNKDS